MSTYTTRHITQQIPDGVRQQSMSRPHGWGNTTARQHHLMSTKCSVVHKIPTGTWVDLHGQSCLPSRASLFYGVATISNPTEEPRLKNAKTIERLAKPMACHSAVMLKQHHANMASARQCPQNITPLRAARSQRDTSVCVAHSIHLQPLHVRRTSRRVSSRIHHSSAGQLQRLQHSHFLLASTYHTKYYALSTATLHPLPASCVCVFRDHK